MANPLRSPMVPRSLRNLVSPPATRRYPSVVRPPFAGARGTLEFDVETCVLCSLCVRRCPTVALTCNREEKLFAIDQLRCIACGWCVDACNKHSLSLSTERRPVHTRAEIGADGRRPGYEVWHKPDPELELAAAPIAVASPSTDAPPA